MLALLVRSYLQPMGDVLVVSRPSLCATDGETDAAVPAGLFAHYLAANPSDAEPLDFSAHPSLRVATGETTPRQLWAKQRQTVVAVSRIGLTQNDALACVEVFATEERGFLLQFARGPDGIWAVRAEHDVWQRAPKPWEQPPEELPDGTVYQPPG